MTSHKKGGYLYHRIYEVYKRLGSHPISTPILLEHDKTIRDHFTPRSLGNQLRRWEWQIVERRHIQKCRGVSTSELCFYEPPENYINR